MLSEFLSDFAPRRVPDSSIELLPAGPGVDFEAESDVEEIPVVSSEVEDAQVDFEAPPSANPQMEDLSDLKSKKAEPKIDVEGIRREAGEEMAKRVTETMEAQFAQEKKAIEEAHAAELANAKEKIIGEIAQHLDERLTQDMQMIAEHLSQSVAEVLGGFMSERLTEQALKDFADKVSQTAFTTTPLVIEGNEVLFEALKKIPSFNQSRFRFISNDESEIRLRQDDDVVSTRLEPLMQELKELVR